MRHRFSLVKLFFLLLAALSISSASAVEYGRYDLKKIPSKSGTAPHIKYGLDIAYVDQIIADRSSHAHNYLPRFDTPQDKARAKADVKNLMSMVEILTKDPAAMPELVIRAAYLGSLGTNLDIAGYPEEADSHFQRFLAARPSDARANYLYGIPCGHHQAG